MLSSSKISLAFVDSFMLTSLFLSKFETTPIVGTISTPALAVIIFLFSINIFATLDPTVPTPIIPTFSIYFPFKAFLNISLYFLQLV